MTTRLREGKYMSPPPIGCLMGCDASFPVRTCRKIRLPDLLWRGSALGVWGTSRGFRAFFREMYLRYAEVWRFSVGNRKTLEVEWLPGSWMVGRWQGQRIRVRKCFRRLFRTCQLRLRYSPRRQPAKSLYYPPHHSHTRIMRGRVCEVT